MAFSLHSVLKEIQQWLASKKPVRFVAMGLEAQ
jgi:hypothetical protein